MNSPLVVLAALVLVPLGVQFEVSVPDARGHVLVLRAQLLHVLRAGGIQGPRHQQVVVLRVLQQEFKQCKMFLKPRKIPSQEMTGLSVVQ